MPTFSLLYTAIRHVKDVLYAHVLQAEKGCTRFPIPNLYNSSLNLCKVFLQGVV